MAGRSIHLFVPDSERSDVRIATVPNWAGSIVTASEGDLGFMLKRPECERHGCYIMMSGNRYDGDASAYIGQTHNLRQRLSSPSHKDRGWEKIAFISTSDSSFSESHFLYLEAEMIEAANKAGSIDLQNGNSGRSSRGNLGEAQTAATLAFFSDVRFVLPVLGFDIFSRVALGAGDNPRKLSTNETAFVLKLNRDIIANSFVGGGFVRVEAGTRIRPASETKTWNYSYKKLREQLVSDGVISESGVFTRDYEFNSPSAASAVILGRSDNGRLTWKLKSNQNISLGEWQESQSNEFENA